MPLEKLNEFDREVLYVSAPEFGFACASSFVFSVSFA